MNIVPSVVLVVRYGLALHPGEYNAPYSSLGAEVYDCSTDYQHNRFEIKLVSALHYQK